MLRLFRTLLSRPSGYLLLAFLFMDLHMSTVWAQSAGTGHPLDSLTDSPMRALQFSYSYMNPVSYRGRTFGIRQWGMMPQLTYQTSTNWHVYTVGYVWNNFQTSELGKIDVGIEKEGKIGQHVSYTLGYEHWFFPNSDPDERQPLTNFLEAYLSREWHDWTPAIGAYYMVGANQLLQTDLELNRYVGITERKHWSLFAEPLVKAILANQNYVINGIFQPQIDRRGRRVNSQPEGSRPYGLVDVEFNLPITLQTPRWALVVDPRLAQPFRTLPEERNRLFFYGVMSLTYTLHLPKAHGN